MKWTGTATAALLVSLLLALPAFAKPVAPGLFCDSYPNAPVCAGGAQPLCTQCHTSAPLRNPFGDDVSANLAVGVPRPLTDADFQTYLGDALQAVEDLDSDADGTTNINEILGGTLPGDPTSVPAGPCEGEFYNPQYDVCNFDNLYAFKKIMLDYCGFSPTYDDVQSFQGLSAAQQTSELDDTLDACLDSEFWIGKNGQLWQIAHPKVRPLGAFKLGEDEGGVPLADYYEDYHLYVWAQIDGHDAREVITADYFVTRSDTNGVVPTTYAQQANSPTQVMQQVRRVGLMSTLWNQLYNTMFTALPRTTAAQMYRAFLGLDIAKMEGLNPVALEPVDYDAKGVTDAQCATCHSTLDPLSYPFRNYNGIAGAVSGQYVPNRIETFFAAEAPNITNMPEAGSIFGTPVNTLDEWAQVAANSNEFAQNCVNDYWNHALGRAPVASEVDEYTTLWTDLMGPNNYSIEAMLHDLIKTEAYGAP